ncbi:hypothetical protein VTL71DRAFT_12516 [Oculimacula yallundae]|uniref:Uncharacterized protein n=1 Tax=Oculimacula yallundae TaxID=86028 RepID=A0ABR4CQ00_9HELO
MAGLVLDASRVLFGVPHAGYSVWESETVIGIGVFSALALRCNASCSGSKLLEPDSRSNEEWKEGRKEGVNISFGSGDIHSILSLKVDGVFFFYLGMGYALHALF